MEERNQMSISERDRRTIFLITKLDDKDLFGLECFLAGVHAADSYSNKQKEAGISENI